MTIAEAKQVRIVDYLSSLGYRAQYVKSGQYWYLSPIRPERTPSFKVNDRINEWYDFGAATGGDLIELGKYLYGTSRVSEVLASIGRQTGRMAEKRIWVAPPALPVESEMKDVKIIGLQHHALLSYLRTRKIDADIARRYCHEIHYELNGRNYFGLAFANRAGGFEIRNAYYKGCINRKDISLITVSPDRHTKEICLFEGFMDFLSYMTLKETRDETVCIGNACDCLVLNSVNNLRKAMPEVEPYEYIYCYLDNDVAGQKTAETIAGLCPGRSTDKSGSYREYKDLNDYLRGKLR